MFSNRQEEDKILERCELILFQRKQERKKSGLSEVEYLCKKTIEKITKKEFFKVRPTFLKNPETNRNLELDLYNEELKLAIEFNGYQHYNFSPKFHNLIHASKNNKKEIN